MSAMKLVSDLLGLQASTLSTEEISILEAEFLIKICEELKFFFKKYQYEKYFRVMRFNSEMEEDMLESNFILCVIRDILATGDYTLSGIAYYTQTPEEVLWDIAIGRITNPTINFFRKLIELHRSIRKDFYKEIVKKIISQDLTV
jgi:hypothetical protein